MYKKVFLLFALTLASVFPATTTQQCLNSTALQVTTSTASGSNTTIMTCPLGCDEQRNACVTSSDYLIPLGVSLFFIALALLLYFNGRRLSPRLSPYLTVVSIMVLASVPFFMVISAILAQDAGIVGSFFTFNVYWLVLVVTVMVVGFLVKIINMLRQEREGWSEWQW